MENKIQSLPLDKLVPHPDNPNRMSKANFAKLIRNIKLSGRYEPLIVRPGSGASPQSNWGSGVRSQQATSDSVGRLTAECYQIINGFHRFLALKELGYKTADCLIWDIDDQQTDILLATLNRLTGSDILDKKIALLNRLNSRMQSAELAKLLPQTKKQIERLVNLTSKRVSSIEHRESSFANPLVFFVADQQQQVIETALNMALRCANDDRRGPRNSLRRTKDAIRNTHDERRATNRAEALCTIAQYYLDHKQAQLARAELEEYFDLLTAYSSQNSAF